MICSALKLEQNGGELDGRNDNFTSTSIGRGKFVVGKRCLSKKQRHFDSCILTLACRALLVIQLQVLPIPPWYSSLLNSLTLFWNYPNHRMPYGYPTARRHLLYDWMKHPVCCKSWQPNIGRGLFPSTFVWMKRNARFHLDCCGLCPLLMLIMILLPPTIPPLDASTCHWHVRRIPYWVEFWQKSLQNIIRQ